MQSLYEFSLEITRWLQLTYPQLEPALAFVSLLGRFEFYLALIPLIYWCIHKTIGKEVAYLLALTYILNSVAKHMLRQPRPYWLDATVGLSQDVGYGIPSGHVQIATVIYLLVAIRAQRRLIWFLAVVGVLLMALSRIYLGVHFLHDVIAGFLLGALILIGYYLWRGSYHDAFGNRILGQRILLAITLPLTIGLVYALGLALIAELPAVSWSAPAEIAEGVSLEEVVTAGGILLGLGIGFILEASRVHFRVDGSALQRVARYLVGILITVVIWRGLGMLLPDEPLWLGLPLRFFRYWLAGMWVAYYAPILFVRVGLAQASPDPDVSLSIARGGIMRQ